MKHKKLLTLLCTGALLLTTALPALANTATDVTGVATTLYQEYLRNGAAEEFQVRSNVAGKSPDAENFINDALDLATRLVPFSLDANLQYYSNTDPTTFFVEFRGREYNDLNQQVRQTAQRIAKDAAAYSTDYEKLCYVNNYIVDHCEYLADAIKTPERYPVAFTAYGCLIDGKAVCEGYANSVQLICELLDIPCIKVTGTAYDGNHIWNAVYLDGKWWMLDVTFNDPIGRQYDGDRWAYFLLDMDTFRQKGTHKYDKDGYETSKQIYTGRTTGQRNEAVPFAGLSLQNAVHGDLADPELQHSVTQTPQNNDTTNTGQSTLAKAEALKAQGLFAGDEQGFRLQDSMTRIEMGVMVMRMNDGIPALQANGDHYAAVCPFTDVPQWAKSSIGFLYDNQLVAGQSATTFGTGAVSKQDYAVMMLRVLHIPHSYQNAVNVAVEHGILTAKQAAEPTATRGDIVEMTYATLQQLQQTA